MSRFVFGIIGKPLAHSFSPDYFNNKFKQLQLDAVYHRFELEDISQFESLIKTSTNLRGLNVTLPYKQSVVPILNQLHGAAGELKTVNTISIENGVLHGYNTDVIGFEELLRKNDLLFTQAALVLGSGGSSSAVQYVLNQNKIPFKVVSRKNLQQGISLSYSDLNKEIIKQHQLVINCTPLGMFPNIRETPEIPHQYLSLNHICIDLIYNPTKTLFLQLAEERNCKAINGYDMLIAQAEASWEIWKGSLI